MDASFVLALPFHHRDLEPDYVGFDEMGGGEAYTWDKNTSAKLCAKIVGEAYTQGEAYSRDTMVLAGVTHASWVVGHKYCSSIL